MNAAIGWIWPNRITSPAWHWKISNLSPVTFHVTVTSESCGAARRVSDALTGSVWMLLLRCCDSAEWLGTQWLASESWWSLARAWQGQAQAGQWPILVRANRPRQGQARADSEAGQWPIRALNTFTSWYMNEIWLHDVKCIIRYYIATVLHALHTITSHNMYYIQLQRITYTTYYYIVLHTLHTVTSYYINYILLHHITYIT